MQLGRVDSEARLRLYRGLAQGLVGVGLVATMIFGASHEHRVVASVAAFLAAAAPFAMGVLIGFLFGIPKTLQTNDPSNPQTVEANTNLEQVSDWLTKILVGVGLTQLSQLPSQIESVSSYVATAIGGGDATSAVVATILIYFGVAGFLWGYLVTRLLLQPEFGRRPDPEAVQRLINAKPPNTTGDTIDEHDAAEVLRFPLADLKTSDQMIAWGRAKLQHDPSRAVDALGKAVKQAPFDRRAIENLAYASLYAPAPDGYQRAITAVLGLIGQPGHVDDPEDADLYGYLACAYGQQYRYEQGRNVVGDQLVAIRDRAVDAAKRAIAQGPQWKALLRVQMNPQPNSSEDDLVALAGDPELKNLLA